jgi:ribosomal protein S18 acetylase RimI-like enzyme
MTTTIKKISDLKDVREIIHIHNATWEHSPGIIDLLENSSECFILFDSDINRVVGYLFLEEDPEGGFAEINDLAIDPEQRKKGYGKILLKGVMNDYTKLKLNADSTNSKLIEFYKKFGFEIECVLENYYSVTKDAVRMVWKPK